MLPLPAFPSLQKKIIQFYDKDADVRLTLSSWATPKYERYADELNCSGEQHDLMSDHCGEFYCNPPRAEFRTVEMRNTNVNLARHVSEGLTHVM